MRRNDQKVLGEGNTGTHTPASPEDFARRVFLSYTFVGNKPSGLDGHISPGGKLSSFQNSSLALRRIVTVQEFYLFFWTPQSGRARYQTRCGSAMNPGGLPL